MKNIVLLGATGSIGTQTLDVLREVFLRDIHVCAMSGYANIHKLVKLANEFKPEVVCVPDEDSVFDLRDNLNYICEIVTGGEGLKYCASYDKADMVVNALAGRHGLEPTLAAIDAGKDIALANKETLVAAGEIVMKKVKEKGVRLSPIDSEHSAIWQCLRGNESNPPAKIIITASGGPFRNWVKPQIKSATPQDALRHPNWNMGAKITVDSATLMNKGLEFIEAMWLYNMPPENIEILVHPQSIIHSMVEFADGAVMAQLGVPDMRLPIAYALTYPARAATPFPRLNLLEQGKLTFEKPDTERFPCLALALRAAKTGGTLPAVMNTLNELAVNGFLKNKLSFYDISHIISDAFASYTVQPAGDMAAVNEAIRWAENFFEEWQPSQSF